MKDIKWANAPTDTAVWIVDNGGQIKPDWYDKNGPLYYSCQKGNGYWKAGPGVTIHHRPEQPTKADEWVPVVGEECEALFSQVWITVFVVGNAHEYGLALENIKTGDIHKIDPEKVKFRPLKTAEEKKRDAFIDLAMKLGDKKFKNGISMQDIYGNMFDDGFTAPKGVE